MAVKPTDLPEWATDPGADKTAPPIAKQEGGWLPLEKPPHQWFNWFFNLVYQWIDWLADWTNNHDHADSGTPGSSAKIDPETEVNWGNGNIEVHSDSLTNRLVHVGDPGVDSLFESDGFKTLGTMYAYKVEAGAGGVAAVGGDVTAETGIFMGVTSTTPVISPNSPKAMIRYTRDGIAAAGAFNATVKQAPGNPDGVYIVEFTSPPADLLNAIIQVSVTEVAGNPGGTDLTISSVLQSGDLKIITSDSSGTGINAGVSLVAYWS